MAGEVRSGEERVDAGDYDPGPHGCASWVVIFVLDTLVKAFSILFWYLVFSGIFGFIGI